MATTFHDYNGDGSDLTFDYSFPTIKKEDVKVQVNNVLVDNFTIPNYATSGTKTVTFDNTTGTLNTNVCESSGAPKAGTANVRVYRDTDVDARRITYQAGSAVKAEDLNDQTDQLIYAHQEEQNQTITTDKIKDGAVTGPKIADDSIDSQHYVDLSIDTAHIANDAVTTDKIADGTITAGNIGSNAITHGKMADSSVGTNEIISNSVDSQHYVDGSIDNVHIANLTITGSKLVNGTINTDQIAENAVTAIGLADNAVDQNAIASDAINGNKIQDNAINSEHITAGSIDLAHMSANSVGEHQYVDASIKAAHIANDTITSTQIATNAITNEELADNSVATGHIINGSITTDDLANGAVNAAKIADNTITATQIADNAITNNELADNSVATGHIIDGSIIGSDLANGAVDTAKIANDAVEADQLLDHASDDTQRAVTTNHIKDNAITFAKIGCEETTLTTTSNTAIPTSKAVADHVANVVDSIGGFKIIADKNSFPEAHPDPKGDAGMVISITDPAGFVVNGSGVSTTGDTITSDGTVTINGFPSGVHSTTTTSNYTLLLQTTSTAHTYDFYRFLAKDADVLNLSSDIDDFGNRYRTGANRTANNSNTNHDGDLFFDQSANKMYVYDGAYDSGGAWKEVTSTGEFKILTLEDTDGSPFDGANQSFNLKDGSNAASVDQPGQLIVSVNGVIQKPNTGTSAPSEGFALVDSDTIIFGAAPGAGASVFVTQCGSAVTLNVPADDSVTAAKLNAGTETTGHYLSKTASGSGIAWAAVPAGVGGATGVDFNDDVKARFGTGNDLEIYHDGSNSYIKDTGTGALRINASSVSFNNPAGTEAIAGFAENGKVELYYDNAKKFETTATGVTVTGVVAATTLTGDGSALTGVASATADGCMYENDQTISNNYTIASGKGAHSVGPITVNATVTVNGNWVVS